MRSRRVCLVAILVGGGALIVADASHDNHAVGPRSAQADDRTSNQTAELATLQAEIETIKGKLPSQSHTMRDVAYHFDNLWFAALRGNWPLAKFYFDETRSHLHWAVRVIPVRKDSLGREIRLADILEALENSDLKLLGEAIEAKDRERFVASYEQTLTGCYACHQASDKAYLTLRVPDHPAEPMIEFVPPAAKESEVSPAPRTSEPSKQTGM